MADMMDTELRWLTRMPGPSSSPETLQVGEQSVAATVGGQQAQTELVARAGRRLAQEIAS